MAEKIDKSSKVEPNNSGWNSWNQRTIRMFLIAAIIIVAGIGTVRASESTEPGDTLYPVKLLTEDVELGLTTDDEAQGDLQAEFAENRLEEKDTLEESLDELRDVFNGEEPAQETTETPEQIGEPTPVIPPAEEPAAEELVELIEEVEQDFTQIIESMRATADKMEASGNVRGAEALRKKIQALEAQSLEE